MNQTIGWRAIVICRCSIRWWQMLFVAGRSDVNDCYLLLFNRIVTMLFVGVQSGGDDCYSLLFSRMVTIVIRLCSIEHLLMFNRTVTIVAPFVLIGLINSWKDFFSFSPLGIQVRIGSNTPSLSYKNDLMWRPIEWDCKTEVLGHSSYRTINTNSCSKAIRSRKSPWFCSLLRKQVIQSIKRSFSCLEDT